MGGFHLFFCFGTLEEYVTSSTGGVTTARILNTANVNRKTGCALDIQQGCVSKENRDFAVHVTLLPLRVTFDSMRSMF